MGLLPENSLLPATSNRNMLAQSLKARQQPRTQLTGQGLLDTAAIGLSPVPVIGDALGLAADASRFYNEPESRTPLNFGLAALGLIPFVPPLVSAGLGKFAQSQGKSLAAPTGPARKQAGAIVYHGSPHKFDQFDSSKIGTGEGAQAYGHGLYFAENPKVAQEYSKISPVGPQPAPRRYLNGTELETGTPEYKAASLLESMTLPQARKLAKEWITNPSPHDDVAYYQKVYETLTQIPSKSAVKQKMGQNLYKVDLPDEAIAKMLDYDAPVNKQPQYVKDALIKSGIAKDVNSITEPMGAWLKTSGGIGAEAASDLAKYGIPGVRYLDGGSRASGDGTRNFVVFPGNEGLLKILERQ